MNEYDRPCNVCGYDHPLGTPHEDGDDPLYGASTFPVADESSSGDTVKGAPSATGRDNVYFGGMPRFNTYLDTVTRHGAPLVIRSYSNGLGAQVFVSGESIGYIDRGSWEGYRPMLFCHGYAPLASLSAAIAFVARELGAPEITSC